MEQPNHALEPPRVGPSCVGAERDNLVIRVMPDVGASQPRNPGSSAPVTGDLLFVHSEIRFVWGDRAATAQHDARHPLDSSITGDVKERAIDSVHGLIHLL